MEHKLKINPVFFAAVLSGRKNFEIRKNDRGFLPGDTVTLCEYDAKRREYTGRTTGAVIGYVSEFEQKPGYVVFSLLASIAVSGDLIGYCAAVDNCACGGDTPGVRAGCANWISATR